MNKTKYVCGLLGTHPNRKELLQTWNHFFTEQGIAASLHYYPTKSEQLQLRLSEMFTLGRTLYILNYELGNICTPLLDDTRTPEPNIVYNKGGILIGDRVEHMLDIESLLHDNKDVQTMLSEPIVIGT